VTIKSAVHSAASGVVSVVIVHESLLIVTQVDLLVPCVTAPHAPVVYHSPPPVGDATRTQAAHEAIRSSAPSSQRSLLQDVAPKNVTSCPVQSTQTVIGARAVVVALIVSASADESQMVVFHDDTKVHVVTETAFTLGTTLK